MGTSSDLESLLITLRAYNVSTYTEDEYGSRAVTFFPAEKEPEGKLNQVSRDKQGTVDGVPETPYHKLFKGSPPTFKRDA